MASAISMVIFALVASISPGPVNLIATSSAAGLGYVKTLPHIFGASLGFCIILLLMGTGLASIVENSPLLLEVLTLFGVAFLLYIAVKIALAPVAIDKQQAGASAGFISGFLCQWLNPKAWIVSLSGVTVFVPYGGAGLLYLVALFFITCFASISIWALLGVIIKQWLTRPLIARGFNYLMAALLVILVLLII